MNFFVMAGIMIIGGIVAVIGMSNQKRGKSWGQPVSIVGVVIALLAAGVCAYQTITADAGAGALSNENKFAYSVGRVVGDYLKEQRAGKKILVVSAAGTPEAKGFLDAKVENLAIADEADYDGGALFDVKKLGKLVKAEKYDIVILISPMGSPVNPAVYTNDAASKAMKGAELVFIYPGGGASDTLFKTKIEKNKNSILATVTYSQSADPDAVPSKDIKSNFDKRYIFKTRDSVQKQKMID